MNKFTYEKELRKPTDLFLPDSISMEALSKAGFIVTDDKKITFATRIVEVCYDA